MALMQNPQRMMQLRALRILTRSLALTNLRLEERPALTQQPTLDYLHPFENSFAVSPLRASVAMKPVASLSMSKVAVVMPVKVTALLK